MACVWPSRDNLSASGLTTYLVSSMDLTQVISLGVRPLQPQRHLTSLHCRVSYNLFYCFVLKLVISLSCLSSPRSTSLLPCIYVDGKQTQGLRCPLPLRHVVIFMVRIRGKQKKVIRSRHKQDRLKKEQYLCSLSSQRSVPLWRWAVYPVAGVLCTLGILGAFESLTLSMCVLLVPRICLPAIYLIYDF